MHAYDFTLRFRLPAASDDAAQYISVLAEAGCDDALVGIGQPGIIALDFTREAGSACEALSLAVRDVRRAIPGAALAGVAARCTATTEVVGRPVIARRDGR